MRKLCVIKAGSAVVTTADGYLDPVAIENLFRQIALIHRNNWSLVLVTSGAVASGRGFLLKQLGQERLTKASLTPRSYAALGQSRLLTFYTTMLERYNATLYPAQVLVTREAFSVRERYTALRETLNEMLVNDILPVINNNDVVSVSRLDFRDNDHLAAYIAGMLDADMLILLSDVDGLYTDNPKMNPHARRISNLPGDPESWPEVRIDDSRSSAGGMTSKLGALRLMASLGIPSCIVPGHTSNALEKVLIAEDRSVGTFTEHRERTLGKYQRWLATGAIPSGTILVSNLGSDALRRRKHRASLLAAGVEGVYGKFERDSIVAIRDENFELLGIGRTRFAANELRSEAPRLAEATVVHANYFLQRTDALLPNTEKPIIEASAERWRSLGFTCFRTTQPRKSITIFKGEKKGEKKERIAYKTLGETDATDLFRRARIASEKLGVTVENWILYDLLEGRDPAPHGD